MKHLNLSGLLGHLCLLRLQLIGVLKNMARACVPWPFETPTPFGFLMAVEPLREINSNKVSMVSEVRLTIFWGKKTYV